jgi:phospholipid/cholesterol/gamma-HCH transport system ATP-binding protein
MADVDLVACARGVDVAFGERRVLKKVDADFPRGAITCVLGGSGSGKTTLLKCLVGLLAPSAGDAEVLGVDICRAARAERHAVLRRVGMLFQQGALFGSMNVGENVRLPLEQHTRLPPPLMDRMVDLRLTQVGLAEARERRPSELSGGMQKRAALARASILDPEVLFCDEPSAGLDPVVSAGIDELLLFFARRLHMSIVVITHELSSVERIADHVVMLVGGEVIAQGPLDAVRAGPDPRLREFFERRPPPAERLGRPLIEELRP